MSDFMFTRRNFIKAAGVGALAVACSGALTACSSAPDANEVTLGDFKVSVTNAVGSKSEKIGTEGTSTYSFVPTVKITYIGSGFSGTSFKNAFSASASGVDMALTNNDTIMGADALFLNSSKLYQPRFETSDSSARAAFEEGGTIRLTVKLLGQQATYLITMHKTSTTITLEK